MGEIGVMGIGIGIGVVHLHSIGGYPLCRSYEYARTVPLFVSLHAKWALA
jgi:hypothetical protein